MPEHKNAAFSKIRGALPKIVLILCVLQPLLDVAGFWQAKLGVSNTVTMLIRMLLLAGTILLGFLLTDRKRYYLIAAALMLALTAGHILACMGNPGGYRKPVLDLINLVRIYFLPLMTICFITFLRQNEAVFPALQKGLAADILLIALVQLLSTLTGTDPHTYSVDQTGILGWFMWTNSQSAILAMLTPITIVWALLKWKDRILPAALMTVVSEATLYVLAPRLAYASLICSGFGVFACILLINRKLWKQGVAIALITCLFIAAYPLSPTSKRLSSNQERAEQTIEKIKEEGIVIPQETALPTDEQGEVEKDAKPVVVLDEKTADSLEAIYRSQDIIWSMVDRFGRDRVFQIYHYTLDPTILANTRQMKINFCTLLMRESAAMSHLFGLNLADMTYQRQGPHGEPVTDNYDVENDFHGVYFLTGYCGLGLMILFLLWFGLRALIAVLRKPKVYFNLSLASFAMAYVLGIIHAYFTASVLRRNNASIYLAIVLACVWYCSRRSLAEKKNGAEPKA